MTSLIKTLTSKPWLSGEDDFGAPVDTNAFQLDDSKVGLRVFFAVATSLFLLFIVGYRLRMSYEDWVPLQEPMLLWLNTGFLVAGSIALELSRRAFRSDDMGRARLTFYAGGLCSIAFLVGQLLAWQQLSQAGYLVSSNPASSFFYLLTAVHGLHILGGVGAWAWALPSLQPGGNERRAGLSIDNCALYWHFLLLIWGALFYLLLQS